MNNLLSLFSFWERNVGISLLWGKFISLIPSAANSPAGDIDEITNIPDAAYPINDQLSGVKAHISLHPL